MSRILFALAVLTTAIVGCGDEDNTTGLYEVKGKLTDKDGKPLANIRVTFHPVKGGDLPASTGLTDKNGEFTLKTEKGEDGAVAGQHKIVLTAEASAGDYAKKRGDNTDPSANNKSIPDVWSNPQSSPRTVEVNENDDNDIAIKL